MLSHTCMNLWTSLERILCIIRCRWSWEASRWRQSHHVSLWWVFKAFLLLALVPHILFIYLLCLLNYFVSVWRECSRVFPFYEEHVDGSWQSKGASSFTMWTLGKKSGHQVWWKVSLVAEPFHCPPYLSYLYYFSYWISIWARKTFFL